MALQVTVKMEKFKETKGTVVYTGITAKDNGVLRQQYIQREAFDGALPPENIEVTIKAV